MTISTTLSDFARSLWLILGMFIVVAIVFAIYVHSEKQIDRSNELRLRSHMLADELRQSSDDLTRMVRSYVATGNPIYKKQYQEVLDIRDGKNARPINYHDIYWDLVLTDAQGPKPDKGQATPWLDLMRQAGFTEQEFDKLAQAKVNSDTLTRTEFSAMQLFESTGVLAESSRLKASQMLQDTNYHQAKAAIMRPISEFHQMMDQRTADAVHVTETMALLLRLTFIFSGLLLT